MDATSAAPRPTPSGNRTLQTRGIEIAAVGRSTPAALNSAFSPTASRMPKPIPINEATSPISAASTSTDRSTWRRLAPSVRSIANSRIRWATVIE